MVLGPDVRDNEPKLKAYDVPTVRFGNATDALTRSQAPNIPKRNR